jgi:hypothetical protein
MAVASLDPFDFLLFDDEEISFLRLFGTKLTAETMTQHSAS